MMNDPTLLTIVAIIAVVALMMVALIMGHNGTLLVGTIAIVAGLGGYQVRNQMDNNTLAAGVKHGSNN